MISMSISAPPESKRTISGGAPEALIAGDHLPLERCPHCRVAHPTLPKQKDFLVHPRAPQREGTIGWKVYACMSCGGLVCGAYDANGIAPETGLPRCIWLIPHLDVLDVAITGKLREFLIQAHETFYAPVASIMVSASAIDQVLKGMSYVDGNLRNRIEQARADGRITSDMAAWAHRVRLDANDQRHADLNATLPTPAHAAATYQFAKTLVDILVVLPARVQRGLGQARQLEGCPTSEPARAPHLPVNNPGDPHKTY
jgi:hypothetical protein